ncbi:organic radical activating enzyme [Beggiatoa alba B18LD]|uniref:Organic radical activating enzyme n=1 Tax=Beggiatoa alba B18LD TaxID=395493 RepID=I3CG43_9GAMM|nr:4Fe-4S single cluster domain-containing protein [Beggiatoa alba]EIJ42586.1 organic radical activating enzyme [Beggiatoa alba B18LD]
MTNLRIYALIPQTRVLGPFLRFAIWVQGCPFHCEGCMTPDALSMTGGTLMNTDELVAQIVATPNIEGITLSGGEPFAQSEALALLLHQVKQIKPLGVIVYSGYTLQHLQKIAKTQTSIADLLAQIDVLIDGLYIATQNDGLSLRGSKNQQVYALTERYATILENHYGQAQRAVEMHLLTDAVMLVGIPGQSLLTTWQTQMMKL